MRTQSWPSVLVGAGFPLVALGELMAFAGAQTGWDLSGEAWAASAYGALFMGILALWIGSIPLARQLDAGVCLRLCILAFAPTVVCAVAAALGFQVINMHFWSANLIFVLPAFWPVGVAFLVHVKRTAVSG